MLVRNINDVKLHLNTNATFDFDQIKHYTSAVQNQLIKDLFGDGFIGALDDKFNDENATLSINEQELVKLLQSAIVYIAYAENLTAFMVVSTNQGLHVVKTESKLPLFRELRIEFQDIMAELGYNQIEQAFRLLYNNINDTDFEVFFTSDEYHESFGRFINNASDFNKAYPIAHSRKTYDTIKTVIDEVEEFVLKSVLSAEYFDLLKERILDDELAAEDRKLMPLIKKVLANLTVAIAAEKFKGKATSKGWIVISQESTGTEFSKNQRPLDDNQTRTVVARALEAGNGYLSSLKNYLFTHADDYPLYKASSAYTDQLLSTEPINSSTRKGIIL